ncbi:MAG: dTDP-4-dehydrorhamnose reductase [Patescibacteria group bacterium]
MRVLLLGAHGQLGMAVSTLLPRDTLRWGREELDLTRMEAIRPCIIAAKPDIIINAAAFTDVDRCEIERELAVAVNEEASETIAGAAKELGAYFIQISTDYVFGGDISRMAPYKESDIPHPVNFYGMTKLSGEQKIQDIGGRILIIRTSGLYGGRNTQANYVQKILEFARMQPAVRATADQVYSPTWVQECARSIWHLIEEGKEGLVHLVNTGAVSRFDFTKAIIEFSGLATDVLSAQRSDFPLLAPRPAFSALTSERIILETYMNDWKTALQNYFKEFAV